MKKAKVDVGNVFTKCFFWMLSLIHISAIGRAAADLRIRLDSERSWVRVFKQPPSLSLNNYYYAAGPLYDIWKTALRDTQIPLHWCTPKSARRCPSPGHPRPRRIVHLNRNFGRIPAGSKDESIRDLEIPRKYSVESVEWWNHVTQTWPIYYHIAPMTRRAS